MQHTAVRRNAESLDGRTAIERRANARIQHTLYLVLYSRIRDEGVAQTLDEGASL